MIDDKHFYEGKIFRHKKKEYLCRCISQDSRIVRVEIFWEKITQDFDKWDFEELFEYVGKAKYSDFDLYKIKFEVADEA